jgi:chromate transporter
VIVNLAVFFAMHVLWPHGVPLERVDWPAAAIGVLALFALVRLRVGVIPVITVSAILGLVLRLA